ncbi:PAS domain-containing sensor histidine kinase [Mesorhizobium sp. CAU 1732]|uniref:sensor histidine kinase n=1 Tax=Mesorhizobium sp. CAU 1732 TaxID=3140358 RepID=UPI0032605874
MTAGCERLVHPSVNAADRVQHRRLICVLLAGPFVLAAAIAQTMVPAFGAAIALGALCATFGIGWLMALLVSRNGEMRIGGVAALILSSLVVGMGVQLSGGASGPLALLVAAIPLEAYWITRSRKVAGVAGGVAVLFAAAFALANGLPAGEASAWQWISPVLYGATLFARWAGSEASKDATAADAQANLPEHAFDAVVFRLNKGTDVETASSQAKDILRLEPDLLLGSGLFDRIHVADRVAFLCAAARVREDGEPQRCDVRVRMPMSTDGAGFYAPFEAEFVSVDGGAVLLLRDGSATAALRDALAEALDKAGATEVAKGRFLAAVSHELRTPLNAIIGFSDMLLHREISGDLAPKQVEHVSIIREAGNHLLSVVNAILDVSKIESGSYQIHAESFDLQPALDLCCAMLEPQATAKQVNLAARLPRDLGEVHGDPRAVQQILLNLVSNAIKFTPEGGSVTVNATRKADTIRIFVNDTGIGISGDDLERLGQPFMQVQNDYTRQFQGTGLGLSLVKGLVRLHGGTMSIESAPGLGTTVMIGLPTADTVMQNDDIVGISVPANEGKAGDRNGIALRKIA